MLVSKYGLMDVLANGRIVLDPSRVAAQIVSGLASSVAASSSCGAMSSVG